MWWNERWLLNGSVAAAFPLSSGDGQMNDAMNDGDESWSVPVLCDDVVLN